MSERELIKRVNEHAEDLFQQAAYCGTGEHYRCTAGDLRALLALHRKTKRELSACKRALRSSKEYLTCSSNWILKAKGVRL